MKIGVFDSGLGGKFVAERLAEIFINDEIVYVNDHANMPYGLKSPQEIQQLTNQAILPLIDAECQAIIIACNSATTNAISWLRQQHPTVFFIGIEPMIKPAAQQSRTGSIAVCATPATLKSDNYQQLKATYASNINVIEPDCTDWARLIEQDQASDIDVESVVRAATSQGCDVFVLGCTHYHYLKDRFNQLAPQAIVLEPTDAIASRLSDQLAIARRQQA